MNLKDIKKIVIPQGEVKKIEANGVVIWQLEEVVVLTSITLSGFTTSYNTYATFTFTGTVTAHYSDGTTANVTSSCTHTTPNMTSAGTKTVTVTYTEDGVTKTATYNITVSKAWRTAYNNSSGLVLFQLTSPYSSWGGASKVPCNISTHTEQLRITYRQDYELSGGKIKTVWNNGGSTTSTDSSRRTSNYTRTFTYTQGKDIVYLTITDKNSRTANASWYQNGLWKGTIPSMNSGGHLKIYKVEEYY